MTLHRLEIVDIIYPVGSIYISVNSTNPSQLFGGTWERIKDKFLLASGDTYANNTTGGSASNFIQGTFTTGSSRNTTESISLSYSGTGYPIAVMIFIDGGTYNNGTGGNTTWYNSVNRYDVGSYSMSKARQTTAPTFSTSGADNYGVVDIIYKNSTSTATTYTRTSSMTVNAYSSSNAQASTACVRFKGNNKTMTYYIGNKASGSIGFASETKYTYIVVYSS